MTRRVVVTGIGVISAIGVDRASFWESLKAGRSGIRAMESIPPGEFRFTNAAEIPGYDPNRYFDPKEAGFLDLFAQYGVIAGREAVADAGIEWTTELRENGAIVTGSALGGKATEEEGYKQYYALKSTRFNPLTIPRAMANAVASRLSLELGVCGPSFTLATACSSSNHAIGHAFWMVRNGSAEIAVAGGSEAVFNVGILHAWEAMRVIASDTCRPFSKERKGLILGDGGAMLVLEPLEAAVARGAHIYAEVAGFGMSADAHHITQPLAEGGVRAMRAALRDGDLAPEQVQYINAHGTGTPANDCTETSAIRSVFGAHADHLAVSSTKSMHGHTLGAAGAIEAAATILAMKNGFLPPTANYCTPDPACDLDVLPNNGRPAQVECALSNSFAFGGLNAVLAFRIP